MSGGQRKTVEEAVRQIRRVAGQLRETRTVLDRLQAVLPAPSPEELTAMERGERPITAEAYLLGVLQGATSKLEDVENDLRLAVGAKALARLEKDWQRGRLADEREWIQSRCARGKPEESLRFNPSCSSSFPAGSPQAGPGSTINTKTGPRKSPEMTSNPHL